MIFSMYRLNSTGDKRYPWRTMFETIVQVLLLVALHSLMVLIMFRVIGMEIRAEKSVQFIIKGGVVFFMERSKHYTIILKGFEKLVR